MADKRDEKGAADESAEKAYAAAAEAASGQGDAKAKSDAAPKAKAAPPSDPAPEGDAAPKIEAAPAEEPMVAFPPKARRTEKASAPVKPLAAAPKQAVAETASKVPPAKAATPKTSKSAGAIAKAPEKKAPAKPAVKAVKKGAAKKPAPSGKIVSGKIAAAAPVAIAPAVTAAPKAAAGKETIIPTKTPTIAQLKDKIMATTKTPDYTAGFTDTISDMQAKAKEAFEKSTSTFGDINDFAKGNVEAIVESGKILVSALQEMGSTAATESRSAFESITADMKELATAKSPTDFFKLQSEIARRNFDAAVATGSKNSEAMLKLASDVIAPISGRVSVAVETARKAV